MSEFLVEPAAIPFNVVASQATDSNPTRLTLAKGERLICHAMVIPTGGELDFHAHLNEEHIFFVTEGEAEFNFLNEQQTIRLGPLQAVLIPAGCFYRYCSVGDGSLVMTRVGTIRGPDARRIGLDGKALDAQSSYQAPGREPKAGAGPQAPAI